MTWVDDAAAGRPASRPRPGRRFLACGLVILGILLAGAILAPYLAPHDPLAGQSFKIVPRETGRKYMSAPYPPSREHPLGSDSLGRDLLSRAIYGTRYTLPLGLILVAARFLLAVPVGLLAAIWSPLGQATRRLNLLTGVLPQIFLAVALLKPVSIVGIPLGQSVVFYLGVLTLIGWPRLAETIRGQVSALMREPFVDGARAVGAAPSRLVWRHVLPHLAPNLAVLAAAEMGLVLLLIAQLGVFSIYLGAGVLQQDLYDRFYKATLYPEWGSMLAETRWILIRSPWVPLVPGAAFFISILACNLVAEGLRLAWKLPESQPAGSPLRLGLGKQARSRGG